MGLVFHEAMYFTSSFVYEKLWYNNESKLEYPLLGYRPHKINSLNKHFPVSIKRKAISKISQYWGNCNFKVAILNPSVNINRLTMMMLNEKIKFVFPESTSLNIPNMDEQIKIIQDTFIHIWNKYELEGNHYQFINAIKHSYKTLNEKSISKTQYDLLLIGSPVNFSVRSEAATALSKNIPTICVDHGNETGTADHPSWGYDEQSYCSHFIGYGRAGVKAINDGDYLKSLYNNNPKYIESNCSFIKNIYKSRSVVPLDKNISQYKIAYVPTKFMGAKRLGPFLSIEDKDYYEWQKHLFHCISKLEYKAHPKQLPDLNLENVKIVQDPIEKCISNYDCFIIDNVLSTAFANIASTDKPIIYFNIGFGNLSKIAETAIRERVIWIDIDLNDPGNLLEKIQKLKNKKSVNNYSEEFCLSDNSDTREETVLKTIKSIMS